MPFTQSVNGINILGSSTTDREIGLLCRRYHFGLESGGHIATQCYEIMAKKIVGR